MDRCNVFIYSNFDFTRKNAGTTRMRYYAKALAGEGCRVYLVSCSTTPLTDDDFRETEPGIFIHQEKVLTQSFFGTLSFVKRLLAFAKEKEGTRAFLFYPSPLVYLEIMGLVYLKLIKRQKVYNELNEIRKHTASFHAPLSFRKPGYSIKKIVYKTVFTAMEPWLRVYDGLICISTSMVEYGKKFNRHTLRIPILTDPGEPIHRSEDTYATMGKLNIGFSGSIIPSKENLDNFAEVLARAEKAGYQMAFNLCGFVSDQVRKAFIENNPLNVRMNYYGSLNATALSSFLSQQDVLVIPRGFSLQNKYGFSTKLSDYLNHRKIVLVTDISDNKLYIENNVNGFIVPADDNDAMYEALAYIADHLEDCKERIIPQAVRLAEEAFYYGNYGVSLKDFLFKKIVE